MFDNAVIGLSEALSRCRCCLERPPEKLLNKPYTSAGETEIYLDMLRECFDIRLRADEDSCGICAECVGCLRSASRFKLQVRRCQELLREQLEQALQALEEAKPEMAEDEPRENIEYDSKANEERPDHEETSEDAILHEKPAVLLEMFDDDGTNIEAMLRENQPTCDDDTAVKSEMLTEEKDGTSYETNIGCVGMFGSGAGQLAMACSVRLERLRQCRICHRAFNQESTLKMHIQKMHTDSFGVHTKEACTNKMVLVGIKKDMDTPYSCKTCSIEFSCKKLFAEHSHTHAPAVSSELLSLDLNKQGVTQAEKLYCCDVCNKSFKRKNHLSIHMKLHFRRKPDKCETCNKRFKCHAHLIRHIRVHTGEKPYKCEICNKHFACTSSLNLHTRIHTGNKPYKCDVCYKEFSQKSYLKVHIQMHMGQKPYKCETCDKRFTQSSSLRTHTKIHREKQYKCEICCKHFTHKTSLDVHIRAHTGQKPYKCEICNKLFSQNSHLKKHLRIHTGQKPYQCQICNKQFARKFVLDCHSWVHSGEKPYQCEICDKRFAGRTIMTTHVRLRHAGQKPYKCDTCDRSFGRKDYLKSHIRIHTGEKPYQCEICNERFNHRLSLKAHMKKHTGQKLVSSDGRKTRK